MPTWVIRIVFNDLARWIRVGLLNFFNRNFVGVTFLFRVQRYTIPARRDKCTQTFEHAATLLKSHGEVQQGRRADNTIPYSTLLAPWHGDCSS